MADGTYDGRAFPLSGRLRKVQVGRDGKTRPAFEDHVLDDVISQDVRGRDPRVERRALRQFFEPDRLAESALDFRPSPAPAFGVGGKLPARYIFRSIAERLD